MGVAALALRGEQETLRCFLHGDALVVSGPGFQIPVPRLVVEAVLDANQDAAATSADPRVALWVNDDQLAQRLELELPEVMKQLCRDSRLYRGGVRHALALARNLLRLFPASLQGRGQMLRAYGDTLEEVLRG